MPRARNIHLFHFLAEVQEGSIGELGPVIRCDVPRYLKVGHHVFVENLTTTTKIGLMISMVSIHLVKVSTDMNRNLKLCDAGRKGPSKPNPRAGKVHDRGIICNA